MTEEEDYDFSWILLLLRTYSQLIKESGQNGSCQSNDEKVLPTGLKCDNGLFI